ncbi:MAG: TIGR02452 family protein [Treponema sp.]|nr:TIGR02452 family protein [Candidatus Treponema equifaecale]
MSREENIEIFNDTEKLCRTNPVLIKAWKESSARQKLILEAETIDCKKDRFETPAVIKVSKKRTFEAAMDYNGRKVAVLNFASASNPGGGVVNGSSAQEECLCRCSTLYYNLTEDFLWEKFYRPHRRERNPIHNDDLIYTPDVVVFKSDTVFPQLLPETSWKNVNVITCAAPNLREGSSSSFIFGGVDKAVSVSDEELEAIHIKRGRKILEAAAADENDVVVLGAFGCGAFMNKPEVVAKAYGKLMEEFGKAFETIEFAVYCSPRDESNFRIFEEVFLGV